MRPIKLKHVQYYSISGVAVKILHWYGTILKCTVFGNSQIVFGITEDSDKLVEFNQEEINESAVIKRQIPKTSLYKLEKNYRKFMNNFITDNVGFFYDNTY